MLLPIAQQNRAGFPPIETTPQLIALLTGNAPVAVGVSGGKDSTIAAFETQAYLRAIGHTGPFLLIHSDLGRVEHKDSRPACERLAHRLGVDLIVVRRQAGDLMDRWLTRWAANVERYRELLCVKLILPWSTPSMRFCTSELKTAIICRDLVERWRGQTIIQVIGLRRQESFTRAQAPVIAWQPKLQSKTCGTQGYTWHPILGWRLEDVVQYHRMQDFPLHEAYTRYGMSRVSCAYCILASFADLVASATNPENHDIYREMVDLEIASAFHFQSETWLGDVAPHLLSEAQQAGLCEARRKAAQRERVEARIPAHLLYTRGWPTLLPTVQEAMLLSEVRQQVAEIMQFPINYREPEAIRQRYGELLARKASRGQGVQERARVPVQEGLWTDHMLPEVTI